VDDSLARTRYIDQRSRSPGVVIPTTLAPIRSQATPAGWLPRKDADGLPGDGQDSCPMVPQAKLQARCCSRDLVDRALGLSTASGIRKGGLMRHVIFCSFTLYTLPVLYFGGVPYCDRSTVLVSDPV